MVLLIVSITILVWLIFVLVMCGGGSQTVSRFRVKAIATDLPREVKASARSRAFTFS
jgi:hypothetical protein